MSNNSNDEVINTFCERLTLLVDARGYPRTNYGRNTILAFEWGVSPPYVYKLFHGSIASPFLIRHIAIQLGTTTDYLLGISDKMDSERYLDNLINFSGDLEDEDEKKPL